MSDPIFTRVGQIVDGDNRFFGRSVFHDWVDRIVTPTDVLFVGLGVRDPGPAARECVRLISLCTMSPDARVWPLKLARLLASHGDPLAGYFGAQLTCAGQVMGPGAANSGARALAEVGAMVGEDPDDAAVAVAVTEWRARDGGRIGGFGVPYRPVDERRTALLRLAAGGPVVQGRYWKLHLQVVAALPQLRPNCAISFSAMLLDIGVPTKNAGMALAALMAHVFLAHAIESAAQDGARAHSLPPSHVDYRGIAARDSRDPRVDVQRHAALRRDR